MPMSMPAATAWYRKTAWIASRTGSLPRNANDTLLTPPRDPRARQLGLDAPRRLDVRHGVVGVLLDAGGDGEDVRVEDDVVGREAGPIGQEPVRAPADVDLALDRVGLALLVEGHDDDRGAVPAGEPRLAQELAPRPP